MTREKAIEIIKYHKILVDNDKSGLLDKDLEYEAINKAIEALEQEPKWIPVNEQLPEEKGQYLVTYHPCLWNTVRYDTYVGLDSFRGKTTWAKNANQKVVAWMPLPDPYKAQESEE